MLYLLYGLLVILATANVLDAVGTHYCLTYINHTREVNPLMAGMIDLIGPEGAMSIKILLLTLLICIFTAFVKYTDRKFIKWSVVVVSFITFWYILLVVNIVSIVCASR